MGLLRNAGGAAGVAVALVGSSCEFCAMRPALPFLPELRFPRFSDFPPVPRSLPGEHRSVLLLLQEIVGLRSKPGCGQAGLWSVC